jgi:hypothetical protein
MTFVEVAIWDPLRLGQRSEFRLNHAVRGRARREVAEILPIRIDQEYQTAVIDVPIGSYGLGERCGSELALVQRHWFPTIVNEYGIQFGEF